MKHILSLLALLVILCGFASFVHGQPASPTPSVTPAPALPEGCLLFDRCDSIEAVLFNHRKHEGRGSCETCHAGDRPLFSKARSTEILMMSDMYKGETCGACHEGKKAFSAIGNCPSCHNYFKP
jgi:c(7)-type cytochrome triheme protein